MADIKLVIKVDEDYYELLKHTVKNGLDYLPCKLIANGTPLTPNVLAGEDKDVKTFYDGEYEVKAKIITRGNCMLCRKPLSEGEGIFFCKECEDKVRESEDFTNV